MTQEKDNQTLQNLKTAMDLAVNNLTKLLYSRSKSISISASSVLLRHGLKAYELYEIEERLQHLEETVEKQAEEERR